VLLLFDENLSTLSADYARVTLGIDVLDARAAGLAGKPDPEVRQFAIQSARILVTVDADLGSLIRFSPRGTPGVIWLRPRPPTEVNIRSILSKWLPKLSEIDLHERLVIVDFEKIRIRRAIEAGQA
jgi:predicted nuclease of predicted toxin-antitoxin system